jgi:DHA1 family bicyclomycin/chloramphenicol resistance-like MFS transporter
VNPDAAHLWRAPPWALAVLLAVLGMLGPFSIDTYIPAFAGIAQAIGATPVQMQQTLSAYLFGFAFMNLFHGALSDSFGRRPVVLWGIAVFTIASAGCALSQTIGQLVFFRGLQGLSTGAGIVVSRAVIRDMFPPAQAQKVMSQVTIYFGVAPAVAPIIGGWLFVHADWHAIFWFLTGIGVVLWFANFRLLPETLHLDHRQPFNARNLMRGYWQLGANPKFLLLALASGVPFNGMFLYVLSAPEFLGTHLRLAPTEFFWFFVLTIAGIMGGAWTSGRLAGRIAPKNQIKYGFVVMLLVSLANVAANLVFKADAWWALLPIAVFGFGWSLMVPVVTLLVLDLNPDRRGLASSLQAVIGSTANGIVAGAIAPLVMHDTRWLAVASLLMMCVGLFAWLFVHKRWPEVGRHIAHPA